MLLLSIVLFLLRKMYGRILTVFKIMLQITSKTRRLGYKYNEAHNSFLYMKVSNFKTGNPNIIYYICMYAISIELLWSYLTEKIVSPAALYPLLSIFVRKTHTHSN